MLSGQTRSVGLRLPAEHAVFFLEAALHGSNGDRGSRAPTAAAGRDGHGGAADHVPVAAAAFGQAAVAERNQGPPRLTFFNRQK